MKRTKLIYRISTILFSAFMLLSGIPDIFSVKEAVSMFNSINMPIYLLPFLGIAKALGVLAILTPGVTRLKEWAYAGFLFDLAGATYCMYASGVRGGNLAFILLPVALCLISYRFYHKKQRTADASFQLLQLPMGVPQAV